MSEILLLLLVIISSVNLGINIIALSNKKNEPIKVMVNKALGIKRKAYIPHKDPSNQLDGMIGPNFE